VTRAPAIMLQGTGSDVGKSLLTAGLCRAFSRRGLKVRPFKPQNMSNNAAVTVEGGEIGRAQALQARACGLAPTADMNPVLLKPQSDVGAQVVVCGKVWGNAQAEAYQALKPDLLPAVLAAFDRLAEAADLVLVEGAGSAAEVNLRAGDIANMGFAEAAQVPVALVGDIDRGGVIASLVGTHRLLPTPSRELLSGFIINKFRGDPRLFDEGLAIITRETGLGSFGVVPWFADAHRLPAEDALAVERPAERTTERTPRAGARIKVAVPAVSRIANFDDLDPLTAEPDVSVAFVPRGRALPGDADLVVLPGSKATLADLAVVRAEGWDLDIRAHLRRGGWLLGLCGGFQMLGRRIADPHGIEGPPGETEGLGLLDLETVLAGDKTLVEAAGAEVASGEAVRGYEMHVGVTRGPALARPFLFLDDRPDGAVSEDGRVLGCYLHGLFAADGFRHAFLSRLKLRAVSGLAYEAEVERTLDALADHLAAHLDLDGLLAVARGR
jgi:adenosylcobyric acid synthase